MPKYTIQNKYSGFANINFSKQINFKYTITIIVNLLKQKKELEGSSK